MSPPRSAMPERLVRLTVPEKFGDVSVDEVMRLELLKPFFITSTASVVVESAC